MPARSETVRISATTPFAPPNTVHAPRASVRFQVLKVLEVRQVLKIPCLSDPEDLTDPENVADLETTPDICFTLVRGVLWVDGQSSPLR